MPRPLLLALGIFALVTGVILTLRPPSSGGLHSKRHDVGDLAPEINAKEWININGPQSLATLSNKVVLVEFWATWCPPCVASIPHLNGLREKYGDRLHILALTDEAPEKVRAFASEHGMKYPLGAGSKSFETYAVESIPHAFLIAPDGKIVWTGHPGQGLDEAVASAVAGK